jgi:hypothetical protein
MKKLAARTTAELVRKVRALQLDGAVASRNEGAWKGEADGATSPL